MRYIVIAFFVLKNSLCIAQNMVDSGMGSKNFDHLYLTIKQMCGNEHDYASHKSKKKELKKDLKIVSVVNDIMLANLNIQQADSILKMKGIRAFISPYSLVDYEAVKMVINGTYIKFIVISATRKGAPITFVGATLKSTYEIHCKSNPLHVIPSVDIDVDFFRKNVMKKISCRFQVFNDLELGVANYMANELHFIF